MAHSLGFKSTMAVHGSPEWLSEEGLQLTSKQKEVL